jgi:hypothetical protein
MIRSLRCLAASASCRRRRVVGEIVLLACCGWLGTTAWLSAQQPPVHYWHQGVMPPGAIGGLQLLRGGPLPGYFQPVEIKAPAGAMISLANADRFDAPQTESQKAGFLIGAVYRLRVTNIRMAEGAEVYPTIEVVNRLYSPTGQEWRFPIPIEITEEDLKLALAGKFVTRVIYLEDPRNALPVDGAASQSWFDVAPGQDPLAVADGLGRPVAILRLGARLPNHGPDAAFFFGSPPFAANPSKPAAAEKQSTMIEAKPAAAEKPAAPKVHILPPPPSVPRKTDATSAV